MTLRLAGTSSEGRDISMDPLTITTKSYLRILVASGTSGHGSDLRPADK